MKTRPAVLTVVCTVLLASCGSAETTPSPGASNTPKPECRPVVGVVPTTTTVTPTGGGSAHYSVGGGPTGLILGADHNLWFSDTGGSRIGRLTFAGALTLWDLSGGRPGFLGGAPDGTIWAPKQATGWLARISPDGALSECPLPSRLSTPFGVTVGPDGNVWVVEMDAGRVARVAPSGTAAEFSVPEGGKPVYITTGPDGNLWFTEGGGGQIGRVTTAGQITIFPLPNSVGGQGAIAVGPDGALWFTEFTLGAIGRITTTGQIKEFPTGAGSKPNGIVAGPDGALWFAESGTNMIGRITVDGVITQRASVAGFPDQLVFTPDGSLWVTTFEAGDLVRIAKP